MNGFEKEINDLNKMISNSCNIVFFGGAGTSTESGIPDFRSKNGLYNQHDVQFEDYQPEYLLSKECLYYNPKVFFEFYRQKLDTREAKPNEGHYALTKLELSGKLKAVITQNIDGLHQDVGSKNVIEIHGTSRKCHCQKCKMAYPGTYILESKEKIPTCSKCGSMVRPDIVLYGENLSNKAMTEAVNKISEADMLIVSGTSLSVYPAAGFISYFAGDHRVVINKEKTNLPLNKDTDLEIEGSFKDILSKITL